MEFTNARLVEAPSAEELDRRFAEEVADYVQERIAAAGTVHLAVSGGSLAERALPRVIAAANERGIDWSNVHIWFADERFSPRGSIDRNATLVVAAGREAAGFRPEHLHITEASDSGISLDEAAERYAEQLRTYVGAQHSGRVPQLDLVLLGMGPDGHTASLFPGLPGVRAEEELVIAVRDSPKPPAERVSLTLPVLAASRRCWLYATGENKREALALARSGTATREESPVGAIRAAEEVAIFADAAALGTASG